jgi:hypothetical protein
MGADMVRPNMLTAITLELPVRLEQLIHLSIPWLMGESMAMLIS